MIFDSVIIGGGLAGLVAGISLQKAGQKTAIVSTGQNAMYHFSGSFESIQAPDRRISELFSEAGIAVHYKPGVRLMPLGTFRESALSLDDIQLFPNPEFADKVLIVNILAYHDFFTSFLAEGLEKHGIRCRVQSVDFPELERLQKSPSEMRSVQIARIMDTIPEKLVREVRILLKDEDTVILPQVFGLEDAGIPEQIRMDIPANVVFAGTMPPSVPGIRTQNLLKKHYLKLGGTFLKGDRAVDAKIEGDRVMSIETRNLDKHFITAASFILASGGFFSKGLISDPFKIYEPVFGLDIKYPSERKSWYSPDFSSEQPYMQFGVESDPQLRAIRNGRVMENLYVAGSVLGHTRPESGTAAGLAIRSALEAADQILNKKLF